MRHILLALSLVVLACGSSQPESPMSPRPSAQQTEPSTAMTADDQPDQAGTPPAAPNTTTPPSIPRSTMLDAGAPRMAPRQPPPSQPSAAQQPINCNEDGDCEAVDDMCGMCQCLSLTRDAVRPACQGPKVQCIMAPCRGLQPVCVAGSCSLSNSSSGSI